MPKLLISKKINIRKQLLIITSSALTFIFLNLLLIDRKIQNAISKDLTDREIENLAVNENSMLTLTQYGVELVKDHLTTLSEVIRVCKSD